MTRSFLKEKRRSRIAGDVCLKDKHSISITGSGESMYLSAGETLFVYDFWDTIKRNPIGVISIVTTAMVTMAGVGYGNRWRD